jgi:hypothetical protein
MYNLKTNPSNLVVTSTGDDIERLAKRSFFLAYNASKIMGRGLHQAQSDKTEDEIFNAVKTRRSGVLSGDYVFGRMMKTSCEYTNDSLTVSNSKVTIDYQSWVRAYPTVESLLQAAIRSLEKNQTPATSPICQREIQEAADYLLTADPIRVYGVN